MKIFHFLQILNVDNNQIH